MEKKEPGDTPHVLNENIFKMGIELLLDNNYTKQDVTNIFEESSINLFSDEIEELLNLPSKYLNVDDKPKNNIIELKLNKH